MVTMHPSIIYTRLFLFSDTRIYWSPTQLSSSLRQRMVTIVGCSEAEKTRWLCQNYGYLFSVFSYVNQLNMLRTSRAWKLLLQGEFKYKIMYKSCKNLASLSFVKMIYLSMCFIHKIQIQSMFFGESKTTTDTFRKHFLKCYKVDVLLLPDAAECYNKRCLCENQLHIMMVSPSGHLKTLIPEKEPTLQLLFVLCIFLLLLFLTGLVKTTNTFPNKG